MGQDVLVVDDSAVIRRTLQAYLRRYGLLPEHIHLASTGREALERAEEVQPSIIFMDIQLPDIDGDEVAAAVLGEDPGIILVVVTGVGPQDERVRDLVSLGAFSVVQKPLRYDPFRRVMVEIEQEIEGAVGTGRII